MIICFLAVLPSFRTSFDSKYLLLLLVVILGLIALRFFTLYKETVMAKNKKKAKTLGESVIGLVQGPDKKELKQFCQAFRLTKDQSDFFIKLCKSNNINHPLRLIENKKALDELFTHTLKHLQGIVPSSREIEKNKTLLFTIREAIDNKRRAAKNITTTRSLQKEQPFTLITKGEEHYQMKVYQNITDGLVCPAPRDSFGNELRLPLWSGLQCLLSTRTGQSYQFNTRILRFESGLNETKMVLAHSNSIKPMPNRNHDRKLFETACYFSQVTVANVVNGRNTEHKFYPSLKAYGGTIIDISVGGCSIRTKEPLVQGEYLQIICNLEKKIEETIIGKVKRIVIPADKSAPLMHIQFAKMSRATMNRIFSYIYTEGAI